MNLFKGLERLTSEPDEYILKPVVNANEMRLGLLKRKRQYRRNKRILLWRILQRGGGGGMKASNASGVAAVACQTWQTTMRL